jgi:hypothetical protein
MPGRWDSWAVRSARWPGAIGETRRAWARNVVVEAPNAVDARTTTPAHFVSVQQTAHRESEAVDRTDQISESSWERAGRKTRPVSRHRSLRRDGRLDRFVCHSRLVFVENRGGS